MKAALIPPIPELGKFGRGSFHLLLSHLLKDPRYADHYLNQRKHGAYLVLDNSAHEAGIGQSASKLLDQALILRAQEVVVPDALEDAEGTIESSISAVEYWFEGDRAGEMRSLDPALMYVPQGQNKKEWVECLKELVRLQIYTARRRGARQDFVIGVSKDYEIWDGGVLDLLNRYIRPIKDDAYRRGIHIQVHMLGWGRRLGVLGLVEERCPWVRSTDSAKPFVYALKGISLAEYDIRKGSIPKYPKRRRNYFQSHFSRQQEAIARQNVSIFKLMAGDNR